MKFTSLFPLFSLFALASTLPQRRGDVPTQQQIEQARVDFLQSLAGNFTIDASALPAETANGEIRNEDLEAAAAELIYQDPNSGGAVPVDGVSGVPSKRELSPRGSVGGAELADIKRHALYAGIAYCFGILDDTWSCGARCRDPLVSKTTQLKHFGNIARKTAGYVGVRDDLKAIIVAFRGSLTPRDFWADAQYVYDEFDLTFSNLSIPVNSQVHQGMLSHYKDAQVTVRQTVQKILKQAGRQDYAIHLSGHSLGGSLASIAAVDLLDMLGGASFAKRIQVWTYGQPRSFNPVMAKWFDGLAFTVTRVAASGDLVPHLPPLVGTAPIIFLPAFPDYIHHQNELFYKNKQVTTCSGQAPGVESLACANTEDLGLFYDKEERKWVVPSIESGLGHLFNYFDYPFGPWC